MAAASTVTTGTAQVFFDVMSPPLVLTPSIRQ
jgi:hypothetical protein